jgi:hypothetical protein
MLGFEVREKLPRRPDPALFHVLQTLTDAFLGIGAGGNVEQALIGCGVLHDGRRLSFHSKDDGTLRFFELLHEVAGRAAEYQNNPSAQGRNATSRP